MLHAEANRWRTQEADSLAHSLEEGLAALRSLDDTLVHYIRQYPLMAREIDVLAAALGESPDFDLYNSAWKTESLRLHKLVAKVSAMTGLPKLVKVDVEEQGD